MNRIITVSFVCFTTLGLGVPRASAWWLFDCHHCGVKVCCRQYNAFSPICCQGPGGFFSMSGYGYGGSRCGGLPWGGSPACGFPGGEGYVSDLPAPQTSGSPVMNGTTTPPASNGSNASPSAAAASPNTQPVPPGGAPRPLPAWGAGVANPMAPGSYPGFSGYGPANGVPSYYSGFPGYGPANGGPSSYPSYPSYGPVNGGPSYYPGYPGYGPAAGFGR